MLLQIKRIFKHAWHHAASTHQAIPADTVNSLQQLVAASERHHSGEIRIYIESGLPLSYLLRIASTQQIIRQRALTLFGKLRVWDTEKNNGVLIYLLLTEQAIEIVADRGLNQAVAPRVWQTLVADMSNAFKRGLFEDGLTLALHEISTLLALHFPLAEGELNLNELPDVPILN